MSTQIPEPTAVLFGSQVGWSPERERSLDVGETCKTCGSIKGLDGEMWGGAIGDGSRIFCAGCCRYGLNNLCRQKRYVSRVDEIREISVRGTDNG